MKHTAFAIFILLMLMGNSFALFKMFTDKQEFLSKFPKLSEQSFYLFRFLPLLNIVGLAGLWFYQTWAVWLSIACGLAVIFFDLYFGIYYHLYVAIISTAILLYFIIRYWNAFK
ncbi:MAG TPA: hypothetical protein PLO99_00690 [Chitinophagaceae bacterium]|jgi:hypothetical protein|nr:hypothetical protein [Chitinophagaceae bacterium]HRG92044.1 hypothetical protein [Chitinophagaceae bacterium]